MSKAESSRQIYTTTSHGYFSFTSVIPHSKIMGIECITDSGSYKKYNLTKNDISALSYTFTLQ